MTKNLGVPNGSLGLPFAAETEAEASASPLASSQNFRVNSIKGKLNREDQSS